MFGMLSQNYQHLFSKNNACILNKIVQRAKQNGTEVVVDQAVFNQGSKQSK